MTGSGAFDDIEWGGVIGRDWSDSEQWWPPERSAPTDAPNVLMMVLDDVGFAQLGCYGSDIATPNIDALAAEGIRFSNFHTTALCSPSRACLLTGRNHHSNGMGRVADLASGFPGYCGEIPRANGFLSEILRAEGYATYAVGKWHLTPDDETHMAGDRSSWPLGRGFDRWYGFHGGETHQFVPTLYCDNHSVQPPRTIAEGYHLSADLADRAIEYLSDLRNVDAEQPFFLYLATGACHSPHHAPREWIDRYRGAFDDGWDAWRARTHARQLELGIIPAGTALSPRPDWVPAWDELAEGDRALAARFMECFAAFLSYTDAHLGRVLDHLADSGDLDETFVVLVSDNGASGEGGVHGSINDVRLMNLDPAGRREMRARLDELGGPNLHNNYPWGWTVSGNTPFRRWKREVHEGGIADPCIVRWPRRQTSDVTGSGDRSVRRQFTHAIDVFPTVLELVGIEPPAAIGGVAQRPVEGTSFAFLLDDRDADAPERHTTQYFEMLGSRAVYHEGWKAVTFKSLGLPEGGNPYDTPFDDDVWELYHVSEDPSETRDLAGAEPERLARMVELWWEEAAKYKVLPISNRILDVILNPRPRRLRARDRYVYRPFGAPVPESVAVDVKNRSHSITAEVEIADGATPNGVLLALGSVLGGFSFHLKDGRLRYVHNLYGKEQHAVASGTVVGPGRHTLELHFTRTGPDAGVVSLSCDGQVVGEGDVPHFTPSSFNNTGTGLTCGYELGPSVGGDYDAPFRFDGTLHRVVVEVAPVGETRVDPLVEFDAIMAEQ
ncbi:MAG TPA: arylsulfatase [Acidimicrobiia bacterium]|jgi:arylsulfatase